MGMLTRLWPVKPTIYCSGCQENLETAERELLESGLGYREAAPMITVKETLPTTVPRRRTAAELWMSRHWAGLSATLTVLGLFAILRPAMAKHLFAGLLIICAGAGGLWLLFPGLTRLGHWTLNRIRDRQIDYDDLHSYTFQHEGRWAVGLIAASIIPMAMWLGSMVLP